MAYHHGDLRNALVEAAERAVDEKGEVPSLRALADLCGVSHGAPYRHFADADDLLGSVAARGFEGLTAAIRAASTDVSPPAAKLARGCLAYIAWGVRHPARYGLMFGDHSPVADHPACGEASARAFQVLIDGCAECGATDPVRTANAAWAALHGAVDLGRQGIGLPGDVPDTVAEDVVEMLLAWIVRQTPSSGPG